jgi:CRISPR-associated protein Cas1
LSLLFGRLGLESAKIPHKSRHGLLWLERGNLVTEQGCLTFKTAGYDDVKAGEYGVPHQVLSSLLLGPGATISHDAVRILSGHSVSILFVGSGGVRLYCAPPLYPDSATIARLHAALWADSTKKILVARKMFAIRFGEVFPHKNLDVLRGIEGARIRKVYSLEAGKAGISWGGRSFDRSKPHDADLPNQCLNHVATAMYAASAIAVYSVGAIPQLGFIHEDSGDAFCLDITDLYRANLIVPVAFKAARFLRDNPETDIERYCRRQMNEEISKRQLVDAMIDRIKELLNVSDSDCD